MRSFVNAIKVLCAGVCVGLGASAGAQVLKTHDGVSLQAPSPEDMSCEQLSSTLVAIDESQYRSDGGAPTHSADRVIFEYETNVSEEYFWRCTTSGDTDPSQSGFSNLANE